MKFGQKLKIRILRRVNNTNIDSDALYFGLTLVVGILSGLVAVLIHQLVHELTDFAQTNKSFTLRSLALGGTFLLISAWITTRWNTWTSGSGIPQIKLALIVQHGVVQTRDWGLKLVASVFSLASGMSLGREGPTVCVTAGVGSSLGSLFSLSKQKIKALVAIGAAGGIAAAFNTPIAAVVFTLEEIVGNLNARMLGSIVISSVIAAVTASAFHGNNPTFTLLQYKVHTNSELFIYLFLGIFCALLGPLWVRSVLTIRDWNAKIFKGHKLTVMMSAFLLVAGASLILPQAIGSGHETITSALLNQIQDPKTILSLLLVKFFLTSFCYASGVSGGLFMPTLFIGAMCGAGVGSLAAYLFPSLNVEVGAYALVGMGAFFASVIRAPFTSILMIFEMTRDYKIILPLMVANIISYVISERLSSGSIYEHISEQDGIHLPTKEDHEVLETLVVEDAMIREAKTLEAKSSICDALKIAHHSEISGYPVVDRGELIGIISTSEIGQSYARTKGQCLVSNVCTRDVITIYPDQSLMVAFHKLNKFKISRLVVVSRMNDKRIVGVLTAEDIVSHFGFHIQEESKYHALDEYFGQGDEPTYSNTTTPSTT